MKIENTTTEEITKLLCQVMESKAGQTDGEIFDEFEKKLKQKYCTEHEYERSYTHVNRSCREISMIERCICKHCGFEQTPMEIHAIVDVFVPEHTPIHSIKFKIE
jgi:hypothetical protein